MKYNLPEVSLEHEQEENSILALKNILNNKNFIIRDLKQSDYGVDLNLEVKIVDKTKKYASNFLAQVQIKDKINSNTIKNKDGTYSYPIETKNINYLSSQPASLFLIYLEDKDLILWEWINEIEKYAVNKLDNSNFQKTITYKFERVLDDFSIDQIYNQITLIGENIKKYKELIVDHSSLEVSVHKNLINSFSKKNEMLNIYINNRNYAEALEIATKLANLFEDEDSIIRCVKLSYLSANYKKTVKFCNKAIELNFMNNETHLLKGASLIRLREYAKAERSINDSLKICESSEAYAEYGLLKFLDNQYMTGINHLKKSISINPQNETAYLYLGQIYSSIFNYSKAEEYLEQVLEINSKNAEALATLGENYLNQDKFESAIEFFHKSLDYDKDKESSLLGIGLALVFLNKLEKGSIYLSKWCSINHNKIFNKGNKVLILHIGWKRVIHLEISKTNRREIVLIFSNGTRIPVRLPNNNDHIHIGVIIDCSEKLEIPVVGKMYEKKKAFDYIISQLESKLHLIKFPSSNNKERIFELSNSTKLRIEEEKDRVYIELDFNGFVISGYTDGKYNNKGYNAFKTNYKEKEFFQVNLICKENSKEICFTVRENVTIIKLN